jgi:hypothetical protein
LPCLFPVMRCAVQSTGATLTQNAAKLKAA